ncbi:hypothetical protein FQN50_002997 [Emmonsiellopsis sp. PD_5]|nr:hypothetical protein FQN50_002997 [Emmonsiellopsis sp. PD_5]
MASPKIIAVYGATGNQGGSVAKSLLGNKNEFGVRAITRNPESERSKALAGRGGTVVKADGFNKEEMTQAFRGAWGGFVNINSDDKVFTDPNGPTEFDLGKILVDSAIEAGVQHLVFSSGPPCTEMTEGKVRMKAMDSEPQLPRKILVHTADESYLFAVKNKIENYVRSLAKFSTASFICPGWYLENFLSKEVAPIFGGFPHAADPEGYLTFKVPLWGGKEDVPWLSITDDFGDIIQGLFLEPEKWNGSVIHGLSDIHSFDEVVGGFQEGKRMLLILLPSISKNWIERWILIISLLVTGLKSRYVPLLPSWEAFDTHGIHELQDVKLMFGFTQITGGRYFGKEPTNGKSAAELKEAGARARGKAGDDLRLITVNQWFKREFGTAAE